ncbi:MAG: hypothetical protein AAB298_05945, partial [Pseudomonadota bacterium]
GGTLEGRAVAGAKFQFVRHNAGNETVPCALANEQATLDDIAKRSVPFGTNFTPQGDEVLVGLKG